LASRAAAETKLAELKRLGISDGVSIRAEDDKRFTVVIAKFAELGAADEAFKDATQKGVRSASLIQMQPEPRQAIIEVRGGEVDMELLSGLAAARPNLGATPCATP